MRKLLLTLLFFASLAFAGTPIKTDTFTEASDTFLKAHTSESGGSWQGAATTFEITATTDDVKFGAAATGSLIGDEAPSETDYFQECEGTLGGTATTDRWGVDVRADGTTTHAAGTSSYYFLRMTGNTVGNVTWDFFRVDSGAPTTSGITGTTSGTKASVDLDDPVKLKLTVSGTGATVTLTLEYDENIDGGGFGGFTTLATLSDTHANRIVTAGNIGIYIRNQNARITSCNAEDLTSGVVPVTSSQMRRRKQ